jgi:excisionase family DNA binding protein
VSEAAAPELFESLFDVLVQRVRDSLADEPLPRRYLSKEALAAHLGISERTIRTWRSHGLPGHRVGREVMYDLPEVEKWIEAHDG